MVVLSFHSQTHTHAHNLKSNPKSSHKIRIALSVVCGDGQAYRWKEERINRISSNEQRRKKDANDNHHQENRMEYGKHIEIWWCYSQSLVTVLRWSDSLAFCVVWFACSSILYSTLNYMALALFFFFFCSHCRWLLCFRMFLWFYGKYLLFFITMHWHYRGELSIGWIVKSWLKSKIILCIKISKANYSHLYSHWSVVMCKDG